MTDLQDRIRRRSNRTVGAILAVVDQAPLPQRDRVKIRRAVMNAVHNYGADVTLLAAGLADLDPDTVMADDWLAMVGFPDTDEAEARAKPLRAAAGIDQER